MGQEDLTRLDVLKESILYYFPNCASFTIPTYERTKQWEQHLKLCPNILKLASLQRQVTCLKKDWLNFKGKDRAIGQVTLLAQNKTLLVSLVIWPLLCWDRTNKIPSKITCLVEQAQHHNLHLGIVINRCVATTKARSVPVILINTTKQNVWIGQPLLAAELFIMEQIDEIEHRASMERKGDNINISFSPVAPDTIRVKLEQVETTPSNITPPTSSEKPSFGPRPDVNATDFDFQAEINFLPFKLNMGTEANMTHDQQSCFINLIYDHQEISSLHDEDLGFWDKI